MQALEKSRGATMAKNSNGDSVSSIPGEFAGTYQAGYEAGYATGKEAGFRQGSASAHQGSTTGAAATVGEAGTASKRGSRMLLGMPCVKCRIYLYSEETHCPGCGYSRQGQEFKSL